MKNYDITTILAENEARNAAIQKASAALSPRRGPISRTRCAQDFEYWAANAVTIRDKNSGRDIPFTLNRAQRRVVAMLEQQRKSGDPVRAIILKSRQWGCSTLIQTYMAWIQLVHRKNWNSVICAHVKDTSKIILGMYGKLLRNYPERLVKDMDCPPALKNFEGSQNTKVITGRNCCITLATAESHDSVRGSDFSMAQLSEVAFWRDSTLHAPEDFIRAVCSSVPLQPMTVVVIESTANGVGNYFHTEWLRAESGKSDKLAIFVPWYEIDLYRMRVKDPGTFIEAMDGYEWDLWERHGCTLEQICWYRAKLAEYPKAENMHAEFPTTAAEAFVSSDSNVFSYEKIERLRQGCLLPRKGELSAAGRFTEDSQGGLSLWENPLPGTHYMAVVDVGGRTARADWSVIAVLTMEARPRVVAQWRGHIDHDLLADKAMRISRHYNTALLVVESNILERGDESQSSLVLQRIGRQYENVYRRKRDAVEGSGAHVGFHTNRATKPIAINLLVAAVRDGTYVERDTMACDEMSTYCLLPSGTYEARRGCHDDILMTRAIALKVMAEQPADTAERQRPFVNFDAYSLLL